MNRDYIDWLESLPCNQHRQRRKVKAYARTQAISESFKILRENVLEAEQRRQPQEIRRTLQAIEDGKAVDFETWY